MAPVAPWIQKPGCDSTRRHPRPLSTLPRCLSQSAPDSGWPYSARRSFTTGSWYLPCQDSGHHCFGSRTQVSGRSGPSIRDWMKACVASRTLGSKP
eukprot:9396699-Heterocapsa_arctica.AAC.1